MGGVSWSQIHVSLLSSDPCWSIESPWIGSLYERCSSDSTLCGPCCRWCEKKQLMTPCFRGEPQSTLSQTVT
uniref:Uncharacterized protein n=1 Tax=Anguilla anguilla TaxID=7936 RepID=A0A0E9P7W8_ANGAN